MSTQSAVAKPEFKVTDGQVVEFRFLTWQEGWEFDAPLVMTKPIYRTFETVSDPEQAIEDFFLFLDDMPPVDESEENQAWRGWPSKQRFDRIIRERLNGKETWEKWEAIAYRIKVKVAWMPEDEYWDHVVLEEESA